MRFQSNTSLCGPTAVSNALEALGVKDVTQDIVASLISRTCRDSRPVRDGTTQAELVRALNRWARVTVDDQIPSGYLASYMLRGALSWGAVAIVGVDNPDHGHWLAVVGMLGEKYLIADSASDEIVVSMTETELLARWSSYETRRGKQWWYYEIIVAERK